MADQAQGLRALMNRARHDHADGSFSTLNLSGTNIPGDVALEEAVVQSASLRADVMNPEKHARDANGVRKGGVYSNADVLSTVVDQATVAVLATEAYGHNAVVEAINLRDTCSSESRSPDAVRKMARVVAITSGKGGVGKTNFSSNLAITLAAQGQRVILVDADLGLANVHVVLGIMPRFHLEHVMRGEKNLKEVLYPGPGGIHIIGGGSGLTELANLDEARRDQFIHSLSELDDLADVVLLDTGAGLSHNVLSFLCAVNEVIVVTTPEPTAITDAYATIKVLSQENPRAQQRLVINMAQSETEAHAVAQRLVGIAQRFLQRDLDCLGYLPHDSNVSRAVRAQQPLTLFQPNAPAARAIMQIASRLGYDVAPTATDTGGINGLLTRMQRFFKMRPGTV